MEQPLRFRGRHHHTLDRKGRVSIPARYREVLVALQATYLIITTDFAGCLVAYPPQEWERVEEQALRLPASHDLVKTYFRFFISGARECPIDNQGRILIPPTLRDHAGLEREVVFVGALNRFEIWDPGRLAAAFTEEQLRAAARYVAEREERVV